jgi:hypothetical protein
MFIVLCLVHTVVVPVLVGCLCCGRANAKQVIVLAMTETMKSKMKVMTRMTKKTRMIRTTRRRLFWIKALTHLPYPKCARKLILTL